MKIRNISGEDKVLPWLDRRLVLAGAVVEVPEEHLFAYTQQEPNWAPADDEAQAVHDKKVAELTRAEEEQAEEAELPEQPTGDVSLVEDNDSADRSSVNAGEVGENQEGVN